MPQGDAERIRRYLCGRVEEARRAGNFTVTFRAGDVHKALELNSAYANVRQVLEGNKFHTQAGVRLVEHLERPPSGVGGNLVVKFQISDTPGSGSIRSDTKRDYDVGEHTVGPTVSLEAQSEAVVSSDSDHHEDGALGNTAAILRQDIIGLTLSEFEELAREYLKAKGFSGAEITVVLKLTI